MENDAAQENALNFMVAEAVSGIHRLSWWMRKKENMREKENGWDPFLACAVYSNAFSTASAMLSGVQQAV